MRGTILLLTGWMLFAGAVRAQDTPSAELSASYSAFRLNGVDGFTLNGGSVSLAGNVNHWFGVEGDFSAYHRHLSYTGAANLQTYLFGPRFSYRSSGRLTPFGQVLVGGFHGLGTNGFAWSAGGGLDIKVSELIAIRSIQVEYVALHTEGATLNSPRVSAGVVFRFGQR